jgi:hypothetical protein
MEVPALEDVLEVLPEDHSAKLHVGIHHVDPQTSMDFCHEAEGLDELLVLEDVLVLEIVGLEEGLDGDARVDLG